MFNGNIWTNSAPLQDIRLQNLSDLDFDLSSSLKVKLDGVIWFSIWFPIDIYSNYMSHRLALIAMQNAFSYIPYH